MSETRAGCISPGWNSLSKSGMSLTFTSSSSDVNSRICRIAGSVDDFDDAVDVIDGSDTQ